MSQTPYLIHEHTKAPHITGCRVFPMINCLLQNNFPAHSIIFASSLQLLSISQESFLHWRCNNFHLPNLSTYQSQQSAISILMNHGCVSAIMQSHLARSLIIHQYVPGSKVSVYKALLGQVFHTRGNLTTVPQQLLRKELWCWLSWTI